MCGSKAGSVYMEIETSTKTGADGTEHESVNLVAKCPKYERARIGSDSEYRVQLALRSHFD